MKLTKKTIQLICDLERLIGDECYNPNSYDGWTIIKHSSVLYPGIAYYLREKDAREALEIFLKEMNYDK